MVKVKVNMDGVPKKLGRIAENKTLGTFLASEAQRGMNKYVPMRTGALSQSAAVKPFKVTYDVPYAQRVYYGKGLRFSRDKHPNATAEWDRAYKITSGQKLADAATQFLKRL